MSVEIDFDGFSENLNEKLWSKFNSLEVDLLHSVINISNSQIFSCKQLFTHVKIFWEITLCLHSERFVKDSFENLYFKCWFVNLDSKIIGCLQ